MKRLMAYTLGLMFAAGGGATAWAGQASTQAWARNGWGLNGGAAGATANYEGQGGRALTRTRTTTGRVSLARGLAAGFDRDGMDLSFSHAIAGRVGPAYAGTFNLSIGRDGRVTGSYGGVVSRGGQARSAQAAGVTSSNRRGGSARATATGQTSRGGTVKARTHAFNRQRIAFRPSRRARLARLWRR